VAEAGGMGLLPISRRTGKSTAIGAFPLAAGSAVAVCLTPSESEVAGDLERDWPYSRPVDSCAAHLAPVSEYPLRRSYPREEPYAVAPLVRIRAGGGQRWPSLPRHGRQKRHLAWSRDFFRSLLVQFVQWH